MFTMYKGYTYKIDQKGVKNTAPKESLSRLPLFLPVVSQNCSYGPLDVSLSHTKTRDPAIIFCIKKSAASLFTGAPMNFLWQYRRTMLTLQLWSPATSLMHATWHVDPIFLWLSLTSI